MKRIIAILIAIAAAAHGANVDNKAFDTNQFSATPSRITLKAGGINASNLNTQIYSALAPVTFDVLQVYPDSQGTNFWWNCGRTNSSGQTYIYQSILATNDVNFTGVTNCVMGSILSFNVVASGADIQISVPASLPHLDTNGLALAGAVYSLTLTNGNEFRMTLQSNITLSTLWTTFGQ